MTLVERFSVAYESPIGGLLIALLVFLGVLLISYGLMAVRHRRKDLLASRNRKYYQMAEEAAGNLMFVGGHKADFFGRRTVVQEPDGGFSVCLVPPPDLATEVMMDRFHEFELAVQHQKLPSFLPHRSITSEGTLVTMQSGCLTSRGKWLPTLREVMGEAHLSQAEAEQLLLELARALAALHDLKTEKGEILYHGFLIPRSIFLIRDERGAISGLRLGDAGLIFAMGAQESRERLGALRKGSLLVDRFVGRTLIQQMPFLAPEQRDPRQSGLVGPEVDFYAFGALAASLFSGERFTRLQEIDWPCVPPRWRPFIQNCLSEDPSQRPKDFLEIEDWLSEPDLLVADASSKAPDLVIPEENPGSQDLMELLERLQETKSQTLTMGEEAEKYLDKGIRSMRGSHWGKAVEWLDKAMKLDPDSSEIQLHLAIALYEQGAFDEAEKLYRSLKSENPRMAKRFREHIAFRV